MYLNHIIIYLMLFIFLVFLLNRRININTLLFLLVLGFIIYFFGIFVIKYFWILLLIWLATRLTSTPQKNRYSRNDNNNRYYRTFTGKEAEEFFNNFFRANFDGNFNYSNQNSKKWHNYGGNFTEIYEDKYYEELGVEKNCSKETLKEAYLKKVKEHHPDRYSDPTEKEYHEEKLKKINEAYDNLIKRYN